MMSSLSRRMLLIAGALLVGACVARRTGPPPERTTVEVDNRGFADMTIYVVDGAQRIRLGTAVGLRKSVLTIPARAVGNARDLQFLADPIGSSRAAVSQSIYVRQGDRVTLMIAP